jgi:protein gp37
VSPGGHLPSISPTLAWVICGGESGRGGRECKPEWVRPVRDLCVERDVPFFFKQSDMGEQPDPA